MAVEKLTYKDGDNPNTKYLLRYKGYNMQGMIEFRFQHEAIVMIFQLEIFFIEYFRLTIAFSVGRIEAFFNYSAMIQCSGIKVYDIFFVSASMVVPNTICVDGRNVTY